MPYEVKTYYLIKRNGQLINIELLHMTNNLYSAEKAMLNTYGLTKQDIVTKTPTKPSRAYSTFDGRNFH